MTNQEAIDMIKNDILLHHSLLSRAYRKALNMGIEALQEQKTGKWQKYEGRFDYNWECSECGCSAWEKTDYCAHCGARMECEEE